MPQKIAKVVVALPVDGPFDYIVTEAGSAHISAGQRVNVQFGNKNTVGFVVGVQNTSRVKRLKPVLSILDNIPVLTMVF